MLSKENQDYVLHTETDRVEIIVLADGVSSCRYSRKGAEMACLTAEKVLTEFGTQLFKLEKKLIADFIIGHVLQAFKIQQKEMCCAIEEFSSTLSFVCLDKKTNQALCFSLGDSLIYKLSDDGCILLNQPDSFSGDRSYAVTTIGVAEKVKIDIIDSNEINGIMICSDGAWRLFYNNNIFNSELWRYSKSGNYYEFKKYIDNSINMDDSTFVIMDFVQNRVA